MNRGTSSERDEQRGKPYPPSTTPRSAVFKNNKWKQKYERARARGRERGSRERIHPGGRRGGREREMKP